MVVGQLIADTRTVVTDVTETRVFPVFQEPLVVARRQRAVDTRPLQQIVRLRLISHVSMPPDVSKALAIGPFRAGVLPAARSTGLHIVTKYSFF